MERCRDRHWSPIEITHWQEGEGDAATYGARYTYPGGSIASVRVAWVWAGRHPPSASHGVTGMRRGGRSANPASTCMRISSA